MRRMGGRDWLALVVIVLGLIGCLLFTPIAP